MTEHITEICGSAHQPDKTDTFLSPQQINLIENKGNITAEWLTDQFPGKPICLCDMYIAGSESWEKKGSAFVKGDITLIDHHLPLPEMNTDVSSVNYAAAYVKEYGVLPKDTAIVLTHTDCDSILSALILCGLLPPDEKFEKAAIAADHTGEENTIADILQAMQDKRDVAFSFKNLSLFLTGEKLDPEADQLYGDRLEERKRAQEIAKKFTSYLSGAIYGGKVDIKIDSIFLPSALPETELIVVWIPIPGSQKHEAKIRLGLHAPPGSDIRKFMSIVDSNFGGRWDAGSNKRGTGTDLGFDEYMEKVVSEYKKYKSQ